MPSSPKPPSAPPHDFSGLAGRISSWTTNGLFTALVVVAALGLGRQTIIWWRSDVQPPQSPLVDLAWGAGFDDPNQPVELAFGESPYELTRQTVTGDARAAAEALLALARRSIGAAEALGGDSTPRLRAFVENLAEQTAADENPSAGWRLHLGKEGLPMVVGTRRLPAPAEVASNASPAPWRVVLWGLALPAGENAWTVNQFVASSGSNDQRRGLTDVPLPPGSRRVLSVGGAAGERIVAFDGQATVDEWKRFYAGWFAKHEPAAVVEWSLNGRGWRGRFQGRTQNVVVQLLPGNGRSTGLMLIHR